MKTPTSQALFGAFSDHAKSVGGSFGISTLIWIALGFIQKQAHAAIDTEEERDAIVDTVIEAADKFVAPKFPAGWAKVREGVRSILDDAIDHLPNLV